MINVLIVDDSIIIRKRIARMLEENRRIKVVGTASNGREALEKIEALKPDVVTLDVEMPKMNGIEALSEIMKRFNIPVIMLSAITEEGAAVTIEALELGAMDFVLKPHPNDKRSKDQFSRELILKVRAAALSKTGQRKEKSVQRREEQVVKSERMGREDGRKFLNPAVAIGISTGGPRTLAQVLPKIPADFPAPIFVAQHMPAGFTKTLSKRLDGTCQIKVKEARNGEMVKQSVCYIAPGDCHMRVIPMTLSKGVMIKVSTHPKDALYKPSADIMMESVAQVYGKDSVGVVMTGMGSDGTKGMKAIKSRGGNTIAEDKTSCVVFGMPRSVIEAGLADIILPSTRIPDALVDLVNNGRK